MLSHHATVEEKEKMEDRTPARVILREGNFSLQESPTEKGALTYDVQQKGNAKNLSSSLADSGQLLLSCSPPVLGKTQYRGGPRVR